MTAPAVSDCAGLWRRTLLVGADGTRDTGNDVVWLQGITAYVDSRGFAGVLHQRGAVFEWHRDVDLEPTGPFPDAGSMHWDGDTLIETGVHETYVEHWVRDGEPTAPTGAVFLRASDGGAGVLVRVGELFGWAGGDEVEIGTVGGPRWAAMTFTDDHVHGGGTVWSIERSEGNVN